MTFFARTMQKKKKNKDVTIVIIVIIVTTYINFYAYRVPKVWWN
jgi:hypothetical protein